MKFIYLIRSQESGSYKIGISNKPLRRLKEIQTANPEEVIIIETFPSNYPTQVETALHNMYAPNKKRGEWFDLGILNEITFVSDCNRIEKNIVNLKKEGNEFI